MPAPFTRDQLALLAAIHAEPRNDLPRLVYADWLDDHGEADLADFIRLQCHRAAGKPDPHHEAFFLDPDVTGTEYAPREKALLRKNEVRWRGRFVDRRGRGSLEGNLRFVRFHRGLPEVAHGIAASDGCQYVEQAPPHFAVRLSIGVDAWGPAGMTAIGKLLRGQAFARVHEVRFASDLPRDVLPAQLLSDEFVRIAIDAFGGRRLVSATFVGVTDEAREMLMEELNPLTPVVIRPVSPPRVGYTTQRSGRQSRRDVAIEEAVRLANERMRNA